MGRPAWAVPRAGPASTVRWAVLARHDCESSWAGPGTYSAGPQWAHAVPAGPAHFAPITLCIIPCNFRKSIEIIYADQSLSYCAIRWFGVQLNPHFMGVDLKYVKLYSLSRDYCMICDQRLKVSLSVYI